MPSLLGKVPPQGWCSAQLIQIIMFSGGEHTFTNWMRFALLQSKSASPKAINTEKLKKFDLIRPSFAWPPSPEGKALANILCYEFFLVTKIVCHPERSAKHGVEGSSHFRIEL